MTAHDEPTAREVLQSQRRARVQEQLEGAAAPITEKVKAILERHGLPTDAAVEDDPPVDPMVGRAIAWQRFVPPRFSDASLDDLAELPAQTFAEVAEWAAAALERQAGNLLLIGPVGTGKTHTAFAVCRHLIEAGRRVAWWPTVELLDGLRPEGALDIDQPTRAEFLFLDDLGGEKPSEWVAERLYLVINRRWLDHRPTIVTSNLEPDALRQAIGARSYDRLRDQAVAVRFSGGSRRGSRA